MSVYLLQYNLNQARSLVTLFSFFHCRLSCSIKPDKNWTNPDKGSIWKLWLGGKTGFEPVKTRSGKVWTGLQQPSQFGTYKPSGAIIFPVFFSWYQYSVRLWWRIVHLNYQFPGFFSHLLISKRFFLIPIKAFARCPVFQLSFSPSVLLHSTTIIC